MNKKDYLNYVSLAKRELKQIEGHQIRICEYAMQVCTIRHGGQSHGYYTITDFANDIGMPSKTLSNWLLTYRNVVKKLEKPITTTKEFEQARKVESYLREERIVKNRINEKPTGSKYASKQPVSDEKVRSIYSQLSNGDRPFEGEFAVMLRGCKHALSVLQKRDLNIIEDDQLAYLMSVMDQASEIINQHLTTKKKKNGRVA